jgi:hypothetical protein
MELIIPRTEQPNLDFQIVIDKDETAVLVFRMELTSPRMEQPLLDFQNGITYPTRKQHGIDVI